MVRLDTLVKEYIKTHFNIELSRSFIQKILQLGAVKFNGEVIKRKGFKFPDASYIEKLEIDDKIVKAVIDEYVSGKTSALISERWHNEEATIQDIPNGVLQKIPSLGTDDIIYEDDNYLLVYKPPGMLVHPSSASALQDCMVYRFVKYMRENLGYVPRAGLLHRLDKPTSGLLLFAKNMRAYNHVKKQFMDRQVLKLYFVGFDLSKPTSGYARKIISFFNQDKLHNFFKLVKNYSDEDPKRVFDYVYALDSVELNGYIAMSRTRKFSRFDVSPARLKGRQFLRIKDARSTIYPLGKESKSRYPIGYTVVAIHTGRTHQIRAQFKYMGIPVVGDSLYGKKDIKSSRLELLAFGLSFYDLSNKRKYFVLPLKFWDSVKPAVERIG